MRTFKWLLPGIGLKRWLALFAVGVAIAFFGLAITLEYKYIGMLEEAMFTILYRLTGQYLPGVIGIIGTIVIILGLLVMGYAIRRLVLSIMHTLAPERADDIINSVYNKRRLNRGPIITVIGGGTGLSVLLRGLKSVTDNITAVVSVGDDGGSSGRLRSDLGMIPPGDLRQCLVALADTEPIMEKLFEHRFGGNGDLAGHSFGNLFIAAMNDVQGDIELALKSASKVLAVRGQVLPSTAEPVKLKATFDDGSTVEGESKIPLCQRPITCLEIIPKQVIPVPGALEAIQTADVCVLGPGSLYTSVLPNLLITELAAELKRTRAIKIYVCNVMTQPGETDCYTASQHVQTIIDHVGSGIIDYAIVNVEEIALDLQERYALEGAVPVIADITAVEALGVKVIKANLINETNLVRHDPQKLAAAIMNVLISLNGNGATTD